VVVGLCGGLGCGGVFFVGGGVGGVFFGPSFLPTQESAPSRFFSLLRDAAHHVVSSPA